MDPNKEQEEFLRQLREIQSKLTHNPVATFSDKEVPPSYTKKSNVPYYKESYALEVKCILDEMKVGTPVLIKCQIAGISVRSLEQKLYQARLYLCDNLDVNDKYKKLCQATFLRKFQRNKKNPNLSRMDEGVIIDWKFNPAIINQDGPKMIAEELKPDYNDKSWKEDLDIFIETAQEGDIFERNGLMIDQKDFDSLVRERFSLIDDFVVSPRSNTTYLKIIKSSILKNL